MFFSNFLIFGLYFYQKSLIDQGKTVNKGPVTVFWKLAIFLATMGFVANFTVRAPKRRSNNQQQNTS